MIVAYKLYKHNPTFLLSVDFDYGLYPYRVRLFLPAISRAKKTLRPDKGVRPQWHARNKQAAIVVINKDIGLRVAAGGQVIERASIFQS